MDLILPTIRIKERVKNLKFKIFIENSMSAGSSSTTSTQTSSSNNTASAGYYGSYYSLTFETKLKRKLYNSLIH